MSGDFHIPLGISCYPVCELIGKQQLLLYNLDFLKNNFTNIEMIIDHDLFLETLLLRIRIS